MKKITNPYILATGLVLNLTSIDGGLYGSPINLLSVVVDYDTTSRLHVKIIGL